MYTTYDNKSYEYKVDSYGLEAGVPLSARPSDTLSRYYVCKNCGYTSPGEEDFTMQSHLGKFHDIIDPFNMD